MTTRNEKTARDVTCTYCGALPGKPCKSSRIPSASSFGGGWGGNGYTAHYEARRDAAREACRNAALDFLSRQNGTAKEIQGATHWNHTINRNALQTLVDTKQVECDGGVYMLPAATVEGYVLNALATEPDETAQAWQLHDDIAAPNTSIDAALHALVDARKVCPHEGNESRPAHLRFYTLAHNPCNYQTCEYCGRSYIDECDCDEAVGDALFNEVSTLAQRVAAANASLQRDEQHAQTIHNAQRSELAQPVSPTFAAGELLDQIVAYLESDNAINVPIGTISRALNVPMNHALDLALTLGEDQARITTHFNRQGCRFVNLPTPEPPLTRREKAVQSIKHSLALSPDNACSLRVDTPAPYSGVLLESTTAQIVAARLAHLGALYELARENDSLAHILETTMPVITD